MHAARAVPYADMVQTPMSMGQCNAPYAHQGTKSPLEPYTWTAGFASIWPRKFQSLNASHLDHGPDATIKV